MIPTPQASHRLLETAAESHHITVDLEDDARAWPLILRQAADLLDLFGAEDRIHPALIAVGTECCDGVSSLILTVERLGGDPSQTSASVDVEPHPSRSAPTAPSAAADAGRAADAPGPYPSSAIRPEGT